MNVVIMIGCSGAGKSTYVENYKNYWNEWHVSSVSADKYMVDAQGNYKFEASRLEECHRKCLLDFLSICQNPNGHDVLFVDNTNLSLAEFGPYYTVARAFGHSVKFVLVYASVETCAEQNTHGVPTHVISNMHKRFYELQKLFEEEVVPSYWTYRVERYGSFDD